MADRKFLEWCLDNAPDAVLSEVEFILREHLGQAYSKSNEDVTVINKSAESDDLYKLFTQHVLDGFPPNSIEMMGDITTVLVRYRNFDMADRIPEFDRAVGLDEFCIVCSIGATPKIVEDYSEISFVKAVKGQETLLAIQVLGQDLDTDDLGTIVTYMFNRAMVSLKMEDWVKTLVVYDALKKTGTWDDGIPVVLKNNGTVITSTAMILGMNAEESHKWEHEMGKYYRDTSKYPYRTFFDFIKAIEDDTGEKAMMGGPMPGF